MHGYMPVGQVRVPTSCQLGVEERTLTKMSVVHFVRVAPHKRGIMLMKFPTLEYSDLLLSSAMSKVCIYTACNIQENSFDPFKTKLDVITLKSHHDTNFIAFLKH